MFGAALISSFSYYTCNIQRILFFLDRYYYIKLKKLNNFKLSMFCNKPLKDTLYVLTNEEVLHII